MFSKVPAAPTDFMALAPKFFATVIAIAIAIANADTAHAQVPNLAGTNIVETTPNIIKKIGTYGTELAIEGDVINERDPCRPNYPKSSVRNNETGTVLMQFLINANGFVSRAKIVETSGFRDPVRAAMIGFLGCKFKPPLKDGVPTEAWIDMKYVWKIE